MPPSPQHLQKLQQLYTEAPAGLPYCPDVRVSEGKAQVTLTVEPRHFFHRDSADNAVVFKALHDAALLAASSLVADVMLLTTHFEVDLSGPVWAGPITAMGHVCSSSGSSLAAQARLYNGDDDEVARGEGRFSLSNVPL